MSVSRRAFVRSVGVGGASVLAGVFGARGAEAWTGSAGQSPAPGTTSLIRLDSNENPDGPSASTMDTVRRAFPEASLYPHRAGTDLPAAIAKRLQVPRTNVLASCGSGEILRIAVQAFVTPARPLVTALPTFETCTSTAKFQKLPMHEVPVDSRLALDLAAMEAKASEGAGLVFICNPNNPTGPVHGSKPIADFITRVRKASPGTVILVDEAYHEYVDDPAYATAVPLALEYPEVIVSRTFSKVYGLAGLRIGYAVGRPETLQKMAGWRLGNGMNMLGIRAAIAALDDQSWVERGRAANRAGRDYLRRTFEGWGFKVAESQGNFVFADIRRSAEDFGKQCRALGVSVGRPFPPLTTWTRVSMGTDDELRRATDVFRKVLGVSVAVGF
jgi:histidinol-phosphate aminotransferase